MTRESATVFPASVVGCTVSFAFRLAVALIAFLEQVSQVVIASKWSCMGALACEIFRFDLYSVGGTSCLGYAWYQFIPPMIFLPLLVQMCTQQLAFPLPIWHICPTGCHLVY